MKITFNYTVEIRDEAKFLAQDYDGGVWEYTESPKIGPGHWNSYDDEAYVVLAMSTSTSVDKWKETLIDLSVNDFEIVDGVLKAIPKNENKAVP